MVVRLALLVEFRFVTDGKTDGQTDTQTNACKNIFPRFRGDNKSQYVLRIVIQSMIDGVGTTPFLNYVRVLKFGRVRSDRSDFGPSETYHKLDE